MANLFDKLNVLMRARVRGALGGSRQPRPKEPGPNLDREVAALRKQIDRALDDEDAQQRAIAALRAQIDDGDRRADEALRMGDEAAARHLVRQLQLDRQRLTMSEADLSAHRRETSELIRQVNALEATVAEVHQAQASQEQAAPSAADHLAARVRAMREEAAARLKRESPSGPDVDERAVDDDLAARRARLSQ